MNRNCKNTSSSNSSDKKTVKSKNSNEHPYKALQETAKYKKLKSLNDSCFLKNEPEITSVIKYNNTPLNNGISIPTTKVKKNIKGLVNHDYCSYCDEGGDLLNCDRCPASFHLLCSEPPLTLDQIPSGEFLCNKCNARAELMCKTNNLNSTNSTEMNLPISNETKTVKFEMDENEPALETLIRMAKSLNPRQMQLSSDLNMECAFDLPGLSKVKWWTKDGNKIVNYSQSSSVENSNGPNSNGSSNSNGLWNSIFESSDKGRSTNKNGSTYNSRENFAPNKENELCFICAKAEKENQLVKCDFCQLRYHLDCLNPPLCSLPARDRLWMCPNHMENFLDHNILDSDRLTKRINLWKKFSLSQLNLNSIKLDFIKKCSQNSKSINSESIRKFSHTSSRLNRCKIPVAIKHVYSRMKNMSLNTESPLQEISQNTNETDYTHNDSNTNESCKLKTRAFVDENEKESYILAVEALQLLSAPSSSSSASCSNCDSNNAGGQVIPQFQSSTQSVPLNKHCKDAVKPRALLQYIPPNTLFNSESNQTLNNQDSFFSELSNTLSANIISYEKNRHKLPQPDSIRYRTVNIGSSSSMDICLDEQKCDFLSDKHASIYFDEETNHYELLNYSEYGTVVDNCFYGFNLDPTDLDDSSESEEVPHITKKQKKKVKQKDDSILSDKNEPQMASRCKRNLEKKTICSCNDECSSPYEKFWEGSAILNHGSRIRFGCIEFLFIIVDYDFVSSRNLPESTSPKLNYFYDLKNKKSKKLKSTVDKNELRALRQNEYPTATTSFANSKINKKNYMNLKKIKKNGSMIKKKLNGASGSISGGVQTVSKKTSMRKYKINKIEAFLKLMNNKNKMSLLDSS